MRGDGEFRRWLCEPGSGSWLLAFAVVFFLAIAVLAVVGC